MYKKVLCDIEIFDIAIFSRSKFEKLQNVLNNDVLSNSGVYCHVDTDVARQTGQSFNLRI